MPSRTTTEVNREGRLIEDLREKAGSQESEEEVVVEAPSGPSRIPLSPRQALLLALFFFVDIFVVGALCLFVTDRFYLPF